MLFKQSHSQLHHIQHSNLLLIITLPQTHCCSYYEVFPVFFGSGYAPGMLLFCCLAENKWNPSFIERSVWERDYLLCLLIIDDEALPCCPECRMNWVLEIDENWESMKRFWSWYCCWVVALTIHTPDLIPYFVASTFPLLVLGITWALSFLSEAHSHTTTIQVFSFVYWKLDIVLM